jgi:hypothetical protein
MEAFNQAIVEAHAHMSNPLRPYMWWSADVRAGKQVLAKHDQQLERKLVVAFKAVPPEHTIAGECQGQQNACGGGGKDGVLEQGRWWWGSRRSAGSKEG